jgi:hypothetical protein
VLDVSGVDVLDASGVDVLDASGVDVLDINGEDVLDAKGIDVLDINGVDVLDADGVDVFVIKFMAEEMLADVAIPLSIGVELFNCDVPRAVVEFTEAEVVFKALVAGTLVLEVMGAVDDAFPDVELSTARFITTGFPYAS